MKEKSEEFHAKEKMCERCNKESIHIGEAHFQFFKCPKCGDYHFSVRAELIDRVQSPKLHDLLTLSILSMKNDKRGYEVFLL